MNIVRQSRSVVKGKWCTNRDTRRRIDSRLDLLNDEIGNFQSTVRDLSAATLRELHDRLTSSHEDACRALTWIPAAMVSPICIDVMRRVVSDEMQRRALPLTDAEVDRVLEVSR